MLCRSYIDFALGHMENYCQIGRPAPAAVQFRQKDRFGGSQNCNFQI